MAPGTVLYDANVLYPSELRNLLMHLAISGLFRARWSASIHEEWIRNLLERRPDLTRAQLERTRQLMDQAALDAVVTGYEDLIPKLHLPDPGDRHVLAAAIRGEAEVIVTMNLRDFPAPVMAEWGIRAVHPDAFITGWLAVAPAEGLRAAQDHWQSLKKPPRTREEYLETLERQGLTQTVSILKELWGDSTPR